MTTYHVELTGHCDVIVEANSEQEAFDRAVARIPSSSLSIETAEVKGVLEGEALKQAYRYFPEHLAMVDTEVFEKEEGCNMPDKEVVGSTLDSVYNARKRLEKGGITPEDAQFLLEDAVLTVQKLSAYSFEDKGNPLNDLVTCKASMDYIEARYARGDQLGPMQLQALYQSQLTKLQKLAQEI